MMRTLLVRGMVAGLAAGLLATLFAYFFGEPSVNAAIGIEEAGGAAHSHGQEPDAAAHDHGGEEALVSRDVQSTVGLLTGVAGYGIAVGGLFALAFAVLHGRVGALRPRLSAALLAAGAFVVVVLVPFLKYPANPPAVGSGETIGSRTALYFGFAGISVLVAIVAVYAGRKLADRLGGWQGGLLGAGGYLVVMAVCAVLMPVVDEVPPEFPGSTLWTFRLASLGTQLVLWTGLGLVFGALVERVLRPRTTHHAAAAAVS
ncbi:CbtA family protein [Amycolatopsis cihanbeyliensis]|uniref:Putative cobalt transporter subunit CbtA n=1 Tax=Amycolatopsis cihanbeyliensis TaxID=1128664 RepID=A0A542CUW2_AMYCI|nr:CbtA family protein [Amycolatopsis cihanbeyliensis]TQI94601.1 putative cobalt transporter subunit CbtA [Amycolatopsis cihanbeyliensis]